MSYISNFIENLIQNVDDADVSGLNFFIKTMVYFGHIMRIDFGRFNVLFGLDIPQHTVNDLYDVHRSSTECNHGSENLDVYKKVSVPIGPDYVDEYPDKDHFLNLIGSLTNKESYQDVVYDGPIYCRRGDRKISAMFRDGRRFIFRSVEDPNKELNRFDYQGFMISDSLLAVPALAYCSRDVPLHLRSFVGNIFADYNAHVKEHADQIYAYFLNLGSKMIELCYLYFDDPENFNFKRLKGSNVIDLGGKYLSKISSGRFWSRLPPLRPTMKSANIPKEIALDMSRLKNDDSENMIESTRKDGDLYLSEIDVEKAKFYDDLIKLELFKNHAEDVDRLMHLFRLKLYDDHSNFKNTYMRYGDYSSLMGDLLVEFVDKASNDIPNHVVNLIRAGSLFFHNKTEQCERIRKQNILENALKSKNIANRYFLNRRSSSNLKAHGSTSFYEGEPNVEKRSYYTTENKAKYNLYLTNQLNAYFNAVKISIDEADITEGNMAVPSFSLDPLQSRPNHLMHKKASLPLKIGKLSVKLSRKYDFKSFPVFFKAKSTNWFDVVCSSVESYTSGMLSRRFVEDALYDDLSKYYSFVGIDEADLIDLHRLFVERRLPGKLMIPGINRLSTSESDSTPISENDIRKFGDCVFEFTSDEDFTSMIPIAERIISSDPKMDLQRFAESKPFTDFVIDNFPKTRFLICLYGTSNRTYRQNRDKIFYFLNSVIENAFKSIKHQKHTFKKEWTKDENLMTNLILNRYFKDPSLIESFSKAMEGESDPEKIALFSHIKEEENYEQLNLDGDMSMYMIRSMVGKQSTSDLGRRFTDFLNAKYDLKEISDKILKCIEADMDERFPTKVIMDERYRELMINNVSDEKNREFVDRIRRAMGPDYDDVPFVKDLIRMNTTINLILTRMPVYMSRTDGVFFEYIEKITERTAESLGLEGMMESLKKHENLSQQHAFIKGKEIFDPDATFTKQTTYATRVMVGKQANILLRWYEKSEDDWAEYRSGKDFKEDLSQLGDKIGDVGLRKNPESENPGSKLNPLIKALGSRTSTITMTKKKPEESKEAELSVALAHGRGLNGHIDIYHDVTGEKNLLKIKPISEYQPDDPTFTYVRRSFYDHLTDLVPSIIGPINPDPQKGAGPSSADPIRRKIKISKEKLADEVRFQIILYNKDLLKHEQKGFQKGFYRDMAKNVIQEIRSKQMNLKEDMKQSDMTDSDYLFDSVLKSPEREEVFEKIAELSKFGYPYRSPERIKKMNFQIVHDPFSNMEYLSDVPTMLQNTKALFDFLSHDSSCFRSIDDKNKTIYNPYMKILGICNALESDVPISDQERGLDFVRKYYSTTFDIIESLKPSIESVSNVIKERILNDAVFHVFLMESFINYVSALETLRYCGTMNKIFTFYDEIIDKIMDTLRKCNVGILQDVEIRKTETDDTNIRAMNDHHSIYKEENIKRLKMREIMKCYVEDNENENFYERKEFETYDYRKNTGTLKMEDSHRKMMNKVMMDVLRRDVCPADDVLDMFVNIKTIHDNPYDDDGNFDVSESNRRKMIDKLISIPVKDSVDHQDPLHHIVMFNDKKSSKHSYAYEPLLFASIVSTMMGGEDVRMRKNLFADAMRHIKLQLLLSSQQKSGMTYVDDMSPFNSAGEVVVINDEKELSMKYDWNDGLKIVADYSMIDLTKRNAKSLQSVDLKDLLSDEDYTYDHYRNHGLKVGLEYEVLFKNMDMKISWSGGLNSTDNSMNFDMSQIDEAYGTRYCKNRFVQEVVLSIDVFFIKTDFLIFKMSTKTNSFESDSIVFLPEFKMNVLSDKLTDMIGNIGTFIFHRLR